MRHQPIYDTQYFFSTAPMPCPYRPDRLERRLVTELIGRGALILHEQLSLAGFRRSHGIAYTPVCNGCDACKAVRVLAKDFKPSKLQRRVWNRNRHLSVLIVDPIATHEQYSLFLAYQRARHSDGDMAKMDIDEYRGLIEDSSVETVLIEFRNSDDGKLVAICLTDRMENGLSAVYSFFDPDLKSDSLGSYMILWLIKEAVQAGLDHVYLGYWISGCGKMDYKAKYQPMEVLVTNTWLQLRPEEFKNEDYYEMQNGSLTPAHVPINLTFDEIK